MSKEHQSDPSLKQKLAMVISILQNEFVEAKNNGQFQQCIGIEKAIAVIKENFPKEFKNSE